jgi:hypothetical protein
MNLFKVTAFVAATVFAVSAAPFSGSVVGSWVNVNSTDATDIYSLSNNDPVGVATFNWGVASEPSTTDNQFTFDGLGFSGISENTPFAIGNFTYKNGSTIYSTGINGVDLEVGLTLTSPISLTDNYTFKFSIVNTTNSTGDPVLDGDIVNVISSYAPTTFTSAGVIYTLNLLGFSNDNGATIRTDFSSPENATQNAKLYARLTSEIPKVPEPSTVLLFGFGLLSLVGLRRRS